LNYYSTDGTLVVTTVDTLAPYASREYATIDAVGEGFSGSLAVTGTQSIVAMVNESPISLWDGDGLMSYRGAAYRETSVILQPVLKDFYGWNSFFAVQNTLNSSTSVTIVFYDYSGSPVHSLTDTLPAYSAHFYNTETMNELPGGFLGSVVVESPNPLVAVVHNVSDTGAAVAHNNCCVQDVVTVHQSIFRSYLPRLVKNYGNSTSSGVLVQNPGVSEAFFEIEFFDEAGNLLLTRQGTIGPGGIWSLYLPTEPWLPDGFVGSGVVSSNEPIAVLAEASQEGRIGVGYSGIGAGDTDTMVYVPFIRKNADGVTTFFSVQNASPSPATVIVTYHDENGAQVDTDSASIPTGAAHTFDQASSELPADFRGSAIIVSDLPIAVIGHVGGNPPAPIADLSIGKARVGGGEVVAGQQVTYTVTMSNGGSDIVNAVVTDTLSPEEAYGSVISSPSGLCSGSDPVICTLTNFTGTQVITLVVTTADTYSGTLTNSAVITPTRGAIDPDSGNNRTGEVTVTLYTPRTCYVRLNDDLTDYDTVQAAVDASTHVTDVVKVAGVCSGVSARPAPPGYPSPPPSGLITQVVYISKTLTLRGGYTTTNWTVSDPVANPTTLDAQGQGRVLSILGEISPTIEGLRITNGNAAGLGGVWGIISDGGGGVYVAGGDINTSVTINNNLVFGNTAWGGGGLHMYNGAAILSSNIISSNTASGVGGGLFLGFSDVTMNGNTIISNTALQSGGLHLGASDATLSGNTISYNIASGDGGGLYLTGSEATLSGNTIAHNTAHGAGGGLYLYKGNVTLTNNVIADSQADSLGSGLYVHSSSPHLLHTTIARNTGGDGSGVHVNYGSVALTNTVLVSHTVGVYVASGNTATLEGTLWGSGAWANGTDWGGAGTIITGTVNIWGDPAFVDPDAGTYHIGPGSAALDAGVDAGVTDDIDRDPRPIGIRPDIGADEFPAALSVIKHAEPDPVEAGAPLTYTLCVTNTGNVDLHTTVTDILPAHVTPTGTLTWTPTITAPGGIWAQTVVVTAEMGYTGPLTNVVQITTEEGATGTDTCTIATITDVPITGLSAVNDSPTPLGSATTLTATITAGSNVAYTCAFGDGDTDSGAVVAHTYPAVGVYTATVTATNSVSVVTATTAVDVIPSGPTPRIFLPLICKG